VSVRLDKWLDVACLFKTRSLAGRACSTGKVSLNGTVAKPHRGVAVGDRVEIDRGDWTQVIEILVVGDKSIAKAEARAMYHDTSPPRPTPDPVLRLLRAPAGRREPGRGRPTKRERRQLERWRRS
jgi:ribosome-associated heat shock protein Hsp15